MRQKNWFLSYSWHVSFLERSVSNKQEKITMGNQVVKPIAVKDLIQNASGNWFRQYLSSNMLIRYHVNHNRYPCKKSPQCFQESLCLDFWKIMPKKISWTLMLCCVCRKRHRRVVQGPACWMPDWSAGTGRIQEDLRTVLPRGWRFSGNYLALVHPELIIRTLKSVKKKGMAS